MGTFDFSMFYGNAQMFSNQYIDSDANSEPKR